MISILTPGILDTIQDEGRYGFAALGINPGGCMDAVAAATANFLCGNPSNEAVIEIHFPAASFYFSEACLLAVAGADFSPAINNEPIPTHTPIMVPAGTVLQFKKQKQGARAYIGIAGGLDLTKWLNSYSTNLKAKAGGHEGRALKKNDKIAFKKQIVNHNSEIVSLPWHADTSSFYQGHTLRIIDGREYSWLSACDATILTNNSFTVTTQSDRMGYRIAGVAFENVITTELISSAVTKGTIQLLPDGQLIILTADHQTTGGYPRIAHVITADLPSLAQMNPGAHIQFERISFEAAEDILSEQHTHLLQLQNACNFRLHDRLTKNNICRSEL